MSELIKTNVCIIGAGPSGAATSLMLSKLKIHHCIIDKAVFPRDKTCGDGLILYAYKSLKILDLLDAFRKSNKFLHSKRINLHVKDNLRIQFKESEDRDMIISYARRTDFDSFLVNHLSNEFAHQEFGNGVKSLKEQEDGVLVKLKDGKEILAQVIVGADGVQSIVSRKLAGNTIDRNLMSTFISAYFEGVQEMPQGNDAEVRMIYNKMPLFFYVFPLADGQANVSLGGRADNIQKYGINLVEEMESILKNHPKVNYKFTHAKMSSNWRGWTIPFHFGKQKVVGNRFVLVGDAAGLANAFYKEGVGTGMMSGILAAETLAGCISEGNFSENALKSYESKLHEEFGKLLKFSHKALRIARFKKLFSGIVSLTQWRVNYLVPKMIRKRSY